MSPEERERLVEIIASKLHDDVWAFPWKAMKEDFRAVRRRRVADALAAAEAAGFVILAPGDGR